MVSKLPNIDNNNIWPCFFNFIHFFTVKYIGMNIHVEPKIVFTRNVPSEEASEALPHLWKSNKAEIKY